MNEVIEMSEPEFKVMQKPEMSVATPANLLQIAVQRGASMDELQKLMDLQERYEANQARKAFIEAKAAFKAEDIFISKDKENKQYKSMYTTLGNLVNTVRPFLGKHGLSADWDQRQENGKVIVTCILSHKAGHSESSSFEVPPDKSGAKNAIQELKSAITYARAITFEAICGLASSDANLDDDGAGYSEAPKEKTKALPIIGGKAFDKAIAAVKAGEYTGAEIRSWYQLSVDQDTVLSDLEKAGK